MPLTQEVFGVSKKQVLSYIERENVDSELKKAIASESQIIVYGASKQGKTALVSKHVSYEDNIVIQLSPASTTTDIYSSILRKSGIKIEDTEKAISDRTSSATLSAKVKALIPLLGSGETAASGNMTQKTGQEQTYKSLSINLGIPDDIASALEGKVRAKFIILENFHYLNDETQKILAFDLRSFQELGVRFIILGVWREKNRLSQFNGDLVDRAKEVPVEPWEVKDFELVLDKGSTELNIQIADPIRKALIEASFSSIGVLQELIKETCLNATILKKEAYEQRLENELYLDKAKIRKSQDYSARHQRALEAIASGHTEPSLKDGNVPLFLPYYLMKVILSLGYDGLKEGLPRNILHDEIKKIHHRADDVRPSDMGGLLSGLASLQLKKSITPPIFDYDTTTRNIQIIDSTFYFFLKNANLSEISNDLYNPISAFSTLDGQADAVAST